MLNTFVEFYRKVGCPSIIDNNRLEYSMALTADNIAKLKELSASGILSLDALFIQRKEVNLSELMPSEDDLFVESTIPTSGKVKVYKSISDLLDRNSSFSKGRYDIEFYITEDDYYSEELVVNPVYEKLCNISKLISGLSDLAHYHDKKGRNKNLVYVSKNDSLFLKPVVIQPIIKSEILNGSALDVSIIDDLLDESGNIKHLSRERGVFRSSIIEFFQDSQSSESEKFHLLVANWTQFLVLFTQNFDTYLSGYAFQKVKHEIAKIEIDLAEQFSKVTNDISGKLLGAPISLVAVVALVKVDSGVERTLVFIGILVAAWILSSLIDNQYEQFSRMKNARAILFSSHESLKVQYPEELRNALESAVVALDKSENKLSELMWTYKVLCWFPVIASVLALIYKFWPECV